MKKPGLEGLCGPGCVWGRRAPRAPLAAAAASASSERPQIVFHKLHDELVVAGITPVIAGDAADHAIVIDFH